NLGKAFGDGVERRVPADASKLAVALLADALQRMQHASVGISALEVARDLGAQHAVGCRMLGVALDLDRASIFDRDMQGAGVGTVVRGCAAHEGAAGTERHGLIEWHGERLSEPILNRARTAPRDWPAIAVSLSLS